MQIMTVLGGILVLMASGLYPRMIEAQGKERLQDLKALYKLCKDLRMHIAKYPLGLEELLEKQSRMTNGPFGKCLTKIQREAKTQGFSIAWESAFEQLAQERNLTKEDQDYFRAVGKALLGEQSELIEANLALCENRLDEYIAANEQANKERDQMNKKLFPLLALGVVILLL